MQPGGGGDRCRRSRQSPNPDRMPQDLCGNGSIRSTEAGLNGSNHRRFAVDKAHARFGGQVRYGGRIGCGKGCRRLGKQHRRLPFAAPESPGYPVSEKTNRHAFIQKEDAFPIACAGIPVLRKIEMHRFDR